jgi:transposase
MESDENTRPWQAENGRYVALDIHKHDCMIGAVNRESEVLLDPRRVEHGQLEAWLRKHLNPDDRVVIEATTNAWHIYDLIEPLVAEVVVANPMKVKQIAYARIKTDKLDVLILARLLAANLIPTVWVPPMHVRELRSLVSQRRKLTQMHTQVINRLHGIPRPFGDSVSHRHHLGHPKGKRFLPKDCAWQKDACLSGMEKLQLELDMATRVHLKTQMDRLTQEMATMSLAEPWEAEALYLMQMPGFGVITTMTVLAAIGDISRFSHPKKLVSYAGLAPGLHQSGVKLRGKGITKEGRKELRWAMVEVAWRCLKGNAYWQERFETYKKRMHPNQAITAVARHLLVIVWHVLSKQEPYRQITEERIAYKFLTWSWQMNEKQRESLNRAQFVRYHLLRLGIGADLERIVRLALEYFALTEFAAKTPAQTIETMGLGEACLFIKSALDQKLLE